MQLRKKHSPAEIYSVDGKSLGSHERLTNQGEPRRRPDTVNPEFVRLDGLIESLYRHKWVILASAATGILVASTFALFQVPVYQSKAALEIQGFNENFLNRREMDPTADANNYALEPYLQTQIKLLQTEALIGSVVDRLQLEQSPEFIDRPSRLSILKQRLGGAPPIKPVSVREGIIKNIASHLTVRLSGQTRIVEVLFECPNPKLAADFTNTLADEFIAQTLDRRVSATHHTGLWLAKQLKELRATLQESEKRLQSYVAANGLLFTSDKEKDSVAEANLRQLQSALLAAHEARVAEQSKYELAANAPQDAPADGLDSDTLRAYHIKLTDLRRELAESRAVLTPAHYKVKQLQAQINELQSALEHERANILERSRKSYEAAQQRESMLRADYDAQIKVVTDQSSKELAYTTLKREVDGNRQLYESTLQRVKEAGVTSAISANNIQVVDPAKPADRPIKPSRPLYSAIGLLLGSFSGIGLALFLERTDRQIHTPAEARSCLNIPQLGAIPAASVDLPYSEPGHGWPALTSGVETDEPVDENPLLRNWLELVTARHRESAMAEAFRAVQASLLFSSAGESDSTVIVLTSAVPSEGKTTIVCNLGIALAETAHRVLLIDADRRRPRLHEVFKIPKGPGFFELLLDRGPVNGQAAISLTHRTDIPGLYVLPSGHGGSRVVNIIGNSRVAELLDRFRAAFDIILIDTPPVLALSDARGLGRLADGVAIVIRANRTPHDAVFSAWQRLSEDGVKVLGTILNNWNPKRSADYTYLSLNM